MGNNRSETAKLESVGPGINSGDCSRHEALANAIRYIMDPRNGNQAPRQPVGLDFFTKPRVRMETRICDRSAHAAPTLAPVRPARGWFSTLRQRRLVRWLGVVLLLLGAGALVLRWYLSSRHAADRVADKLAGLMGVPVQVDTVEISFTGDSQISVLSVFENDPERVDVPWLKVNDVVADISAFDMLTGATGPDRATLTGAAIELKFDREGHMLTRLPRPTGPSQNWPRFQLKAGSITLSQEGRALPLVLNGLTAQISVEAGTWALAGTLHDPFWGDWKIEGAFYQEDRRFTLHMLTDGTRVNVTQEHLERVPFMSLKVCQQLRNVEGNTSVDFTLNIVAGVPGADYRVELDPRDTRLHVASIDLDATETSGRVVIENRQVQLRGVKGRMFGGNIATEADMDFRGEGSKVKFDVDVRQVQLEKLPASWHLPKAATGPLSGKANLEMNVNQGKTRLNGDGKGVIGNILPVTLHADGERFRFKVGLPKLGLGWLQPDPTGPIQSSTPLQFGAGR
jgi:AsmA-like C-terminal region